MATVDLYHGAEGRKMLFNIGNQSLTADSQGRLFFALSEWQNCLVHGADSQLGESYVGKFRVEVPADAELINNPTSGNRDAKILSTRPGAQVRATIIELYVRRGRVGDFEIETIVGQGQIQRYLEDEISGPEKKQGSGPRAGLRHFEKSEIRITVAQAGKILSFFFPSQALPESLTDGDVAFAQALLIEAVDASSEMSYVQILADKAFRPPVDFSFI
jgi:hypothetical protein